MKLKGKLCINRVNTSDGHDYIRIAFMDESSECLAAEAQVTPEMFGLAVTGLSYVNCTLEFNDSGVIGKKRAMKEERVFIPLGAKEQDVAKYLKPFEVDGWKGRTKDAVNHHHWGERVVSKQGEENDGHMVRIFFERYV